MRPQCGSHRPRSTGTGMRLARVPTPQCMVPTLPRPRILVQSAQHRAIIRLSAFVRQGVMRTGVPGEATLPFGSRVPARRAGVHDTSTMPLEVAVDLHGCDSVECCSGIGRREPVSWFDRSEGYRSL